MWENENCRRKAERKEGPQNYLDRTSRVFELDQEFPLAFSPYPLFRLHVVTTAEEVAGHAAIEPTVGAERRRSRRFHLDAGVVIRGVSFGKGAFDEAAITISVSAHGALVLMSTKVAPGHKLFLKNAVTQNELPVRVVRLDHHTDTVTRVSVEFTEASFQFWPPVSTVHSETSIGAKFRIPACSFAVT